MTDKEAMQMALETAEQIASADYRHWGELASLGEFERWARSRANHIAEALRARLAQPEPEPVADKYLMEVECTKCGAKQDGVLTVTAPPQRERIVFPTMLRKMWSGTEVQAWLDENVNKEKNT